MLLAACVMLAASPARAMPDAPDARPVITDMDPLTLPADYGPNEKIELFGQHFQNNSEVRLGSTALSTTFISTSQLDFFLPPGPEMRTAGRYSITVFTPGAGNGTSDPAPLTITAGSLFSITVLAQPASGNASTARVTTRQSAVFSVRGVDRYANQTPAQIAAWSVSDGLAFTPATGVSTTVQAGLNAPLTATVTARVNSITATGRIIVSAPKPTTITLSAPTHGLGVDVGQARIVSATVTDENGAPITSTAVNFSVANPGVAAIESSGPLTALLRAVTNPVLALTTLTATVQHSPTVAVSATVRILTPTISIDLGPALHRSGVTATLPVTISLRASQSDAPLGAGIPITLSALSSAGQCSIAPAAGFTSVQGVLTAQVSCTGFEITGPVAITVTAAFTGAPGASSVKSGMFDLRPRHVRLPFVQGMPIALSGNNEACKAVVLTAGTPVLQAASDRYVFYDVAPVNGALRVMISNFPTSGRVLLYKIFSRNCPGSVSTGNAILSRAFDAPGYELTQAGLDGTARYLLIIQNTGELSNTQFTVVYQP